MPPSDQWLVWDNYQYDKYLPGIRCGGSATGYGRLSPMPHTWKYKNTNSRGINILYFDLHAEIGYNQRKLTSDDKD
jgi:prepilin-type processing-associated H-X9-DG protein